MRTPIYIMTMYDNYRDDPEGDYEYLEHSGHVEILINSLTYPFDGSAGEVGPEELVIFTADNEDLRSGLIPVVIRI